MPPLRPTVVDSACDARPLSELDIKVEELVREVKAGRLKSTVDDVRIYCSCARKTAAKLAQLLKAELSTGTQAG